MKLFKRLTLALIAGVITTSSLTSIPVSAADDCQMTDPNNKSTCLDGFYSDNDILYYDPNATDCAPQQKITSTTDSGSSDPNVVGSTLSEKLFKLLLGKGLTGVQAAGVLGNMWSESSHNPKIRQGGAIAPDNFTPIPGEGFGLIQWTDPGRQQNLVEFARSTNRKTTDIDLQIDFMWQEMNNNYKHSLDALKAAKDPVAAAIAVHGPPYPGYEASADSEATVIANRGGKATEFYNQFKDLAPSQTVPSSAGSGCAPAESSNNSGGLTEFMSDAFKIYNQCQYPPYGGAWGTTLTPYGRTLCAEACVPTALAMVSKNMAGQDVTPADTAKYYADHDLWMVGGGGSSSTSLAAAAGDFGLRAELINNKTDVNAYKEVFDKGGLIIAVGYGSAPFLPQGHAVVLRGITTNGEFLIADPGQGESTNTPPGNIPKVNAIMATMGASSYSASYAFYKK